MSGCDFHDTTGHLDDHCSCGVMRRRISGTVEDRRTRGYRERLERALEIAAYFLNVVPEELLELAGDGAK